MILHYASLGIVSAMAMLLLCIIIINNETLNRKMKLFFSLAIMGIVIVSFMEIGANFYAKPYTNLRIQNLMCNAIGFSVSPFIPLFITLAICKVDFFKVILWFLPAMINMIFALFSPFGAFIFMISSQNIYSRGPFFSIYMLSYIWGIVLLVFETAKTDRRYQTKNSHILYLILIFMAIGTTIQILLPIVHTTWICVALSTSIYYAYFCELSEKYDAQTYLFNRRAYECEVERIADAAEAYILYFDIDNFKIINDTYGHQFGDQCLYTVACCIKDTFQNLGLCFRIGGDEFCVISKSADLELILNTKKDFMKNLTVCKEKDKRIPKVSVGCGHYKKGFGKVEEAIKNADEQLYVAKNSKKFT